MFALPGYAVREEIHRSRRAAVYRATRLSSQREVVIKLSPASDPVALLRFRHEFRLASSIAHEHVLSYLALEPCGERVAIVQEDFGGASLATVLSRGALPLALALEVALQVARGLAEVHAHEVIHRAIHPGNILVHLESRETKIGDFADATLIRHEAEPGSRAHGAGMPLVYVSPEQTGRMNRAIDHRTDFYSLGATLYHMLVGRPPFVDEDRLALVHAHIARAPAPLCELDRRIPETVSHIVDKLLAKNAEDRYQSATGIVADLSACLRQLSTTGKVMAFPVGLADVPERFELPKTLYGRDAELARLLEAFDETAHGARQLVLVRGASGVGKSSLVSEVRRPIVERRGFFLAGKFDQLHRNVPYAALRTAFLPLCEELLSEREETLAALRAELSAKLSGNAALLVHLVPELERVIGTQTPPPPTGLFEAQHRFTAAVQRFVSVLASPEHPMVLFLDDLQWADPASLHILRALLTSNEIGHLLVVGAYRDNEVDGAHPFALFREDVTRAQVPCCELSLRGLSERDVESLICDALRAHRRDVAPLARVVFEKTSGNPFFVDEFLSLLSREKLLTFSPEARAFVWDLARIDELALSENVVDLMLRRLAQLPESARRALRLAACLGDRFGLSSLAEATGEPMHTLRAMLEPAIRAHLLAPLDSAYPFDARQSGVTQIPDEELDYRYRFPHDRVRQAAYELTQESERRETHLAIGRMLLARIPQAEHASRVFEIVDQLARGAELIEAPEERGELARLCLMAGTRARAANAYSEAFAYLRTGLSMLAADAFEADYALASALHARATESAYLSGRFEEADRLADDLLPRLQTALERAEVYTLRIVLEANRSRYDRSVLLGRKALRELGVRVPEKPSTAALLTAHLKAQLLLSRRNVEALADLPDLTDPRLAAAVAIIEALFAPAYFMDPKLFFWLIHECLFISLAHGNAPASSVGYVSYGLLLSAAMGKHERAEEFGRLGLRLADRYRWIERRAKLNTMFGLFIHHFRDHARTSIEYAQKSVGYGIESGDLIYACYAGANYAECTVIVGDALDDVLREAERGRRFSAPLRHHDVDVMFRMLEQFVRALRGETDGPASMSSHDVDEASLVADVKSAEARIMLAIYLIWKVQLSFMFHRHEQAMELAFEYDALIEDMTAGQLRMTEYAFYTCLSAIACLREKRGDPKKLKRLLAKKEARLALWAKNAPVNYEHKLCLVRAERADLAGDSTRAVELYDRAIHEARAQGYQQNAALAAELCARSFARLGRAAIARTYRLEALSGYARWGAHAKVRELESMHDEPARATRLSSPSETLDLESVLAATRAISSEIDPERLVERTLRIIVENAGAERAALLTVDETRLRLEAVFDVQTGRVEHLRERPVEGSGVVAESVVRYVFRTNESVVLADARSEGGFLRDPYVQKRGVKSMACMPIRHKDRTTGVLFLENALAHGAFTTERLGVLDFLVSQVAISLENARLYDRTRSLNEAVRESERRFNAFLDGLPVGVFVLEPGAKVTFANQKARAIAGAGPLLSAQAVYDGFKLLRAGTSEPYPAARLPFARALSGESVMVDDVELALSGLSVPLAIWATPTRDESGAVRWALVAFQDIGPQRAAEQERARLEEQLARTERLDSIGRLSGGIAHDFNNLLTPMIIYAEMAMRDLGEGTRAKKQIAEVHRAAERAAELTRQLLAFGRMEAGQAHLLDVDAEVAEFLRMFRRIVRENVEVVHESANSPCRVIMDAGQLQRVLMNLGLNAVDAMPEGGTLRIAVRAEAVSADRYVVLRVSDTGVGMDARTKARIFEPFFTTKGPGQGTGLGLPTVYGLVTQLGGHIRVESEPGAGASFAVFLPESQASGPRPGRMPELTAHVPRPTEASGVVLLVEDDEAVRTLLVSVLEEEGYRVTHTGDPLEALSIASQLGPLLRLVISDVMMPKMNGLELGRRLSALRPDLPLLFVSGYPDEALASQGLLEPGIQLLRKPFASAVIRRKVAELLTPVASPRA